MSFDDTFHTGKRCQGGTIPGFQDVTLATETNVDVNSLTEILSSALASSRPPYLYVSHTLIHYGWPTLTETLNLY